MPHTRQRSGPGFRPFDRDRWYNNGRGNSKTREGFGGKKHDPSSFYRGDRHGEEDRFYNKRSNRGPRRERDRVGTNADDTCEAKPPRYTYGNPQPFQRSFTNKIHRFKSPSSKSGRYMHQLIFDELSAVNVIQNDCICTAWNLMEYRF